MSSIRYCLSRLMAGLDSLLIVLNVHIAESVVIGKCIRACLNGVFRSNDLCVFIAKCERHPVCAVENCTNSGEREEYVVDIWS